jgi:ABC-type uncharacterized transport system involved in gliding motility auxiliary subunit
VTSDQRLAEMRRQHETLMRIDAETKQATLATIAILPMIMLVCYVGLILYFRSIGGYRQVLLESPRTPVATRH